MFFLDDLAVITLTESFVDLGHQNILPICLPEDDYDYTDYATQYTIIGMSVLDSSNLHHLIRGQF